VGGTEFMNVTKFGAQLCMVQKLGRSGIQISNTLEVLEYGAGEG
jgi:hypothetical protein